MLKEYIIEYKWLVGCLIGAMLYYLYLLYANKKFESSLQHEYNQILTSEEYKVKSQFD